jgi:hypothetical protein
MVTGSWGNLRLVSVSQPTRLPARDLTNVCNGSIPAVAAAADLAAAHAEPVRVAGSASRPPVRWPEGSPRPSVATPMPMISDTTARGNLAPSPPPAWPVEFHAPKTRGEGESS